MYFLDATKAIDKVWYKGIVSKRKQKIMPGKILNLLSVFLRLDKFRHALLVHTGFCQGFV